VYSGSIRPKSRTMRVTRQLGLCSAGVSSHLNKLSTCDFRYTRDRQAVLRTLGCARGRTLPLALAGTPETRNSECSEFLRRVSAAMIAWAGDSELRVASARRPDTPRRATFKTAPGLIASAAHHQQSVHLATQTPDPRGRPSWARGGSWACLGQRGEYS
jgi:hypothetical protein